MNRLVPIAMHMGYVGEAGSTVIEETEESLSTLQEFLKSIAPSLQTLLFNIIASIVIYIVGKKLIAIALKILEKFLSHTSIDVGVSKFLLSAARMAMYVLLAFVIVGSWASIRRRSSHSSVQPESRSACPCRGACRMWPAVF